MVRRRGPWDVEMQAPAAGLSSPVNQFCGPGAPPPHPRGQKVRVVLRAKARTVWKSASYGLWEAWGTKANKNHTFSINEWFALRKVL